MYIVWVHALLMIRECCINCRHFAWWDGDYCCLSKFTILEEGETIPDNRSKEECENYKSKD